MIVRNEDMTDKYFVFQLSHEKKRKIHAIKETNIKALFTFIYKKRGFTYILSSTPKQVKFVAFFKLKAGGETEMYLTLVKALEAQRDEERLLRLGWLVE